MPNRYQWCKSFSTQAVIAAGNRIPPVFHYDHRRFWWKVKPRPSLSHWGPVDPGRSFLTLWDMQQSESQPELSPSQRMGQKQHKQEEKWSCSLRALKWRRPNIWPFPAEQSVSARLTWVWRAIPSQLQRCRMACGKTYNWIFNIQRILLPFSVQ